MKIVYVISTLFLVMLVNQSIAQTMPRSEFTLQLSKNQVEIKPGTATEVSVSIVRSKSFTRSKGKLGLSSTLPQGVSITFEPAEGLFESSVATVNVAENVKAGTYQLIVNAELNHIVKGSILKLTVTDKKSNEVVMINE